MMLLKKLMIGGKIKLFYSFSRITNELFDKNFLNYYINYTKCYLINK